MNHIQTWLQKSLASLKGRVVDRNRLPHVRVYMLCFAKNLPLAIEQTKKALGGQLPADAYMAGPLNLTETSLPQWETEVYVNEQPPDSSETFRKITDGLGNLLPNLS